MGEYELTNVNWFVKFTSCTYVVPLWASQLYWMIRYISEQFHHEKGILTILLNISLKYPLYLLCLGVSVLPIGLCASLVLLFICFKASTLGKSLTICLGTVLAIWFDLMSHFVTISLYWSWVQIYTGYSMLCYYLNPCLSVKVPSDVFDDTAIFVKVAVYI